MALAAPATRARGAGRALVPRRARQVRDRRRLRHGGAGRRARRADRELAHVSLARAAPGLVLPVAQLAHVVPDAAGGALRRQRAGAPARAVRGARDPRRRGPVRRPRLGARTRRRTAAHRRPRLLECEIVAEHPAGDHWIVVGRVDNLRVSPIDGPARLLRWRVSRRPSEVTPLTELRRFLDAVDRVPAALDGVEEGVGRCDALLAQPGEAVPHGAVLLVLEIDRHRRPPLHRLHLDGLALQRPVG